MLISKRTSSGQLEGSFQNSAWKVTAEVWEVYLTNSGTSFEYNFFNFFFETKNCSEAVSRGKKTSFDKPAEKFPPKNQNFLIQRPKRCISFFVGEKIFPRKVPLGK